MKTVALILIILFSVLFGAYKAAVLKGRKDELSAMLSAADGFRAEIVFSKTEITGLLNAVSEKNRPPVIQYILQESMSDGLAAAYDNAKLKCRDISCLTAEDWKISDDFFEAFGKSGLDNQLVLCERFRQGLTTAYESASENCKKYARLYVTAGLTVGIFIAVLFV